MKAIESWVNYHLAEDKELSSGCVYAYQREPGKCVFVWNSNGSHTYKYTYTRLQELKKEKESKPLSFWFIDLSIKPLCEFQSFFGGKSYDDSKLALLAVRIKDFSVIDLENELSSDSSKASLIWAAWNDMLYSFLSLMFFCENNYKNITGSYLSTEIEIYDSNDIVIADLFLGDINYSFLKAKKPSLFDFPFLSFKTRYNRATEDYHEEIIPVINATLQKAIKALKNIANNLSE